MKVVQINAVYGVLSTGRSTKEIADYLKMHDCDCVCFYGEQKAQWGEEAYFVGNQLDHKLHALQNRLLGRQGYGSKIVTAQLIRRLKELRPDVVHLQNLHGNFVNIPQLLSYLAKEDVPTVVTLHDCFFFTGGCMHYTVNGCYQWRAQCRDCKYLRRRRDYWFVNGAHFDLSRKVELFGSIPRLAVIGVSDWILNQAKQSRVFGAASLYRRIYNWVDLDVFRPLEPISCQAKKNLGLEGKFMLLGVAAMWTDKKGLSDFVALSKRLPQDYVIVLVGRISSDKELPESIVVVPPTNNVHELVDLYSSADVFVHLSKEETFGKVTAEALACGTPCVVIDSTASPELVGEGCGYVVGANADVDEIKSVLAEVKNKGKEAYSQKCRMRAVGFFNKEANISQHMDLYEEIAK